MRISAHKRREWLGGRHRAGRISAIAWAWTGSPRPSRVMDSHHSRGSLVPSRSRHRSDCWRSERRSGWQAAWPTREQQKALSSYLSRVDGRLSVVPAIAAGRRPVPCSCCPSPFADRVEWAFIPKQRPRTHVNSTRDCDCSRSHPEAETRFGEPEDYFGILPVSLGDAVKSKRSKSGQVAGETRGFFSRYLR